MLRGLILQENMAVLESVKDLLKSDSSGNWY